MVFKVYSEFNIYDLYDHVVRKPGLYITDPTISNLEAFISGAKTAFQYLDIFENKDLKDASHSGLHGEYIGFEFDSWINEKLNTTNLHHACILLKEQNSSEKLAFEKFVELYKEYRGKKYCSYNNNNYEQKNS